MPEKQRNDTECAMFGQILVSVCMFYPDALQDEYLEKYTNFFQNMDISIDDIINIAEKDQTEYKTRNI